MIRAYMMRRIFGNLNYSFIDENMDKLSKNIVLKPVERTEIETL